MCIVFTKKGIVTAYRTGEGICRSCWLSRTAIMRLRTSCLVRQSTVGLNTALRQLGKRIHRVIASFMGFDY